MALTKVEAEQLQPAQTSITSVGTLTGLNTTGDITVTKSSARIRAIESGGATTQIAAGTATGYVGNYSNHPLQILTNTTAAITIDTSQNATFAGTITAPTVKATTEFQIFAGGTDIGAIFNSGGALTIQGTSTRDVSLGSDSYTNALFIEGSNGRVSIGDTSTSANNLRLANASAAELDIVCSNGKNFRLQSTNASAFSIIDKDASNANRFHIDTNGNIGIGESSPSAKIHVKKTAASTQHYDLYATAIIEDTEARLQLVATDGGSNAAGLLLSNETKHWGLVHHGAGNSNIFSIGYHATSSNSTDISDNLSDALNITTAGHVGINTGSTINGTGTRVLQVESTTASALGPEVLIHNSGQGADAKAALTFGGKRSGNEGYTASIHTTNNDGMYFGTVAATNFSALPTTRMHIDEDGYITTPYQPSAAREVSSSIPNINCHTGGFFRIPFATSRHDQGGLHSYVSGNSANGSKFTAPVAGVYFYSCMVRIDGFSGNYFYLDMRVNGTTRQRHLDSETGSYLHRTVAGVYYLAAGDYITFEIANSGDTNVQVDNNTYMSMHLLG